MISIVSLAPILQSKTISCFILRMLRTAATITVQAMQNLRNLSSFWPYHSKLNWWTSLTKFSNLMAIFISAHHLFHILWVFLERRFPFEIWHSVFQLDYLLSNVVLHRLFDLMRPTFVQSVLFCVVLSDDVSVGFVFGIFVCIKHIALVLLHFNRIDEARVLHHYRIIVGKMTYTK